VAVDGFHNRCRHESPGSAADHVEGGRHGQALGFTTHRQRKEESCLRRHFNAGSIEAHRRMPWRIFDTALACALPRC
jgi:hypothetical protein